MAGRIAFRRPFPGNLDLSELSPAELETLKDEIVERSLEAAAGKPAETGPSMMSDVAWVTDDWAFMRPWEWVELVAAAIINAAVLVGSGLIVAGAALASSHMF